MPRKTKTETIIEGETVVTPTVLPVKEEVAKTQTAKETNYVVWLKGRAYVSDKERLNAGVYVMQEVPVRLSKLPNTVVEVFENEVPSKKVAQIGRWSGFNPDGMLDKDILSKVLATPKPYI